MKSRFEHQHHGLTGIRGLHENTRRSHDFFDLFFCHTAASGGSRFVECFDGSGDRDGNIFIEHDVRNYDGIEWVTASREAFQ